MNTITVDTLQYDYIGDVSNDVHMHDMAARMGVTDIYARLRSREMTNPAYPCDARLCSCTITLHVSRGTGRSRWRACCMPGTHTWSDSALTTPCKHARTAASRVCDAIDIRACARCHCE